MNYYNENDPKAAEWIRQLIKAKLIPAGYVDERSIVNVRPDDLVGFVQCHFFAGIAGWSLALKLAGWSETEPVWTGSCPCQPFTISGLGLGTADERHLWPVLFKLIKERRPATVFGEQVASPSATEWLDGVYLDLEGEDYACGSSDLCAASRGSPQNRPRFFWLANSNSFRGPSRLSESSEGEERKPGLLVHADGNRVWDVYSELTGKSGSRFRVESGTFPLAHGIPNRVGLLRGYGNAIVPQVAAEFIKAAEEARLML